MSTIKILGVKVDILKNGLYSLNGLFKASGGRSTDRPKNWLKTEKVKEYVAFLTNKSNGSFLPFDNNQQLTEVSNKVLQVKEGSSENGGGTFVCKQLVYAYAMWVSVEFLDAVITAFDHLANDRILEAQAIANTTINDIIKKREPNDVSTLAVVVGCTVYESRYYYELLVVNGLLTKKVNKEGQAKFFPVGTPDWFEGYKRNTMLFNDKILAHIPLQSDWMK